MNVRNVSLLVLATFFISFPVASSPLIFEEGFEGGSPQFHIVGTGTSFDPSSIDASFQGTASLKVNPSTCAFNCFDDHRVDLFHAFSTPTYVSSIGLWALEDSTTADAWGGKLRVGHDGVWDLDWWGIVDNHQPITGDWLFKEVLIDSVVSYISIRVWDVTNRSTVWVDKIQVFGANVDVPEPPSLWLLLAGFFSLLATIKMKYTEQ